MDYDEALDAFLGDAAPAVVAAFAWFDPPSGSFPPDHLERAAG
jgi:hypothetical protein